MKISILTLFPEMFDGFINTSIIKKARLKEIVEYDIVDIRLFTKDKHKRVDDYPFGGGQGMVMFPQPVIDALRFVKTDKSHTILMSPAAPTFNQNKARSLVKFEHLIIICAHYEGYDERILNYVDEVISLLVASPYPLMCLLTSALHTSFFFSAFSISYRRFKSSFSLLLPFLHSQIKGCISSLYSWY